MNKVVLDASSILAVLFQEKGGQKVISYLPESLISAVNYSEIITKAVDVGMSLEEVRLVLSGIPCEVAPFGDVQAFLAAGLRAKTKPFGLSFADRACLALGLETGYPVLTADRKWSECDSGIQIIQIR